MNGHVNFISLVEDCESFSELLQDMREDRNLTQAELGKKLHRSHTAIHKLENNILPRYFRLIDVEKIADALECSKDERTRLVNAFLCTMLKKMLASDDTSKS